MTGFTTIGSALPWINKHPGTVLDYVIDFTDQLGAGETLSSVTVSAESGITVGSSPAPSVNGGALSMAMPDGTTRNIAAGKAVVVWLSGGTVGGRYDITVTAPSGSRVLQQSFQVRVVL